MPLQTATFIANVKDKRRRMVKQEFSLDWLQSILGADWRWVELKVGDPADLDEYARLRDRDGMCLRRDFEQRFPCLIRMYDQLYSTHGFRTALTLAKTWWCDHASELQHYAQLADTLDITAEERELFIARSAGLLTGAAAPVLELPSSLVLG